MEAPRTEGIITVWFSDRRYGFVSISHDPHAKRVFLHGSNVRSGRPAPGRRCTFLHLVSDKGEHAELADIESSAR